MRRVVVLLPMLAVLTAAGPPGVGAYAGRGPSDPIAGVTFFKHPAVIAALTASVPDPALRKSMLAPTGPSSLLVAGTSGIKADGCDAHACNERQWTFEVPRTPGPATVCYHESKSMGTRSRWTTGKRSEMRPGNCFGT